MLRKLLWSAALLFLFVILGTANALAQTCSCEAPDGRCHCSITCSGGSCAAVCTEGSCICCCPPRCPRPPTISVQLTNVPASTAAETLSATTGKRIEVTRGGEKKVSLDLSGVTLTQALRHLQRGYDLGLRLDGKEFVTKEYSPSKVFSICLTGVDLGAALSLLSDASGADIRLTNLPSVNLTLKISGTVPEILSEISRQSRTEIRLVE